MTAKMHYHYRSQMVLRQIGFTRVTFVLLLAFMKDDAFDLYRFVEGYSTVFLVTIGPNGRISRPKQARRSSSMQVTSTELLQKIITVRYIRTDIRDSTERAAVLQKYVCFDFI